MGMFGNMSQNNPAMMMPNPMMSNMIPQVQNQAIPSMTKKPTLNKELPPQTVFPTINKSGAVSGLKDIPLNETGGIAQF